jgi:hypothetical protein
MKSVMGGVVFTWLPFFCRGGSRRASCGRTDMSRGSGWCGLDA